MRHSCWGKIAAPRVRLRGGIAGAAPVVERLEGRRLMARTTYLSDLAAVSETNGWGPVELDTSNGEQAAGDGTVMGIGGKTYKKGLGVRAGSTIVYDLGGKYDRFESAVGLDREVGKKGSVYFRVYLDGKKVYDSGKRVGGQAAKSISLKTVGKKELKLVVADAGDGAEFDHADWANARLTSKRNLPSPIPAAPSELTGAAVSTSQVDLNWKDNAGNERRFNIERSIDGRGFKSVATVGADVSEYHETGLSAGTTYYFRVRAANAVGNSAYTSTFRVTTRTESPPDDPPTSTPGGTKPTADNTGPTDPSGLASSGSIVVTTDGAVIEGVDVHGTITVHASNVTIRNFRVNSSRDYGIFIGEGAENVTISDGELTGSHIAAIYGANFTARRLNIHNVGADGIKAANDCIIDGCYIHNLGMDRNSHADGIQVSGGGDLTITNNNIDMPEYTADGQVYLSNATIFVHSFFGPVDNVLIEDNWLNGGNYTVYSVDGGNGYGAPTDVRIVNNAFGPDYKYGILNVQELTG